MIVVLRDIGEELIDNLASCVEAQSDIFSARIRINHQIMEHDILNKDDVKMIDRLIELVQKMKEANPFDLRGRSRRMTQLESEYSDIKGKLVARMSGSTA